MWWVWYDVVMMVMPQRTIQMMMRGRSGSCCASDCLQGPRPNKVKLPKSNLINQNSTQPNQTKATLQRPSWGAPALVL